MALSDEGQHLINSLEGFLNAVIAAAKGGSAELLAVVEELASEVKAKVDGLVAAHAPAPVLDVSSAASSSDAQQQVTSEAPAAAVEGSGAAGEQASAT